MTVRVLSYNIHSGVGSDGRRNYRRIGRLLRDLNIDVALLQEMDTRHKSTSPEQDIADICAKKAFTLAPSPAIYENNSWYGNAILSRHPILFSKTIDVSQKGLQPRNIQEALIQTKEGKLRVINTHKGLKRQERRKQFELLDNHLRDSFQQLDTTLVVGGDFNEWQLFSSAFHRLNQILTPHRLGPTFHTRFPVLRLDRVWTANTPAVKKVAVVRNRKTFTYSDHYPILVELAIKSDKPQKLC